MKRTGAAAHVFYDTYDPARNITGDGTITTTAGQWYEIIETATGTDLPYGDNKTGVFRAPITGQQITLKTGDVIFPIDKTRVCKTTASVSFEEGEVDVSDDCDPGAKILDGMVQISGSLGKLARWNDTTNEFDEITEDILGKFIKIVKDDGEAHYEEIERENSQVTLMINLDTDAKANQFEHWLILPAIIKSSGINLGNTDVQNQDMSFSKGMGDAILYSAPKPAA